MTEPRSTIDLLRTRTAKHHRDLESGLRIQDRLSKAETRDRLVDGYFTFYRETETAIRPHLWDMSELAFSARVRSRDIPSKAGRPRHETLPIDAVFPAIETKAEALGGLYVVEGSTLGGRKILQELRSQSVSTDDLHFIDPYGKQTAARWHAFLAILERETGHSDATMSECVSGAIKAFGFAAMCLRQERTN
jgi:heme oxygenase (biliverdin-IX-beta and delta-forming)